MAFSATLMEQGPLGGNLNYRVYQLTDVQAAGSTLTVKGWRTILSVMANNGTDTDEVMYPSVGTSANGNKVTFKCGDNNDDGYAFLIGR